MRWHLRPLTGFGQNGRRRMIGYFRKRQVDVLFNLGEPAGIGS